MSLAWKHKLIVLVVYHLRMHETILCIGVSCHVVAVRGTPGFRPVTLPAIWWRFVDLQCGSVTSVSDGLTLLIYNIRYA
jgi:hypothetical protein